MDESQPSLLPTESESDAFVRRLYALADAGKTNSPKSIKLRQIAGDAMRRMRPPTTPTL